MIHLDPFDWLMFAITRWVKRRRERKLLAEAQHWPTAEGEISGANFGRVAEMDHDWDVELIYYFVADGEYWSGKRTLPARSEGEAEELVRRCKNRRVLVRYAPENPDRSVLLLEELPQSR